MQSLYARINNPYKIEENKPALKVGMYVSAEILGEKISQAIKIPRNIINNNQVWLVNTNNKLIKRDIQVLFYDKEHAIVKEGLSEGEQILLTKLSVMVNGMKVAIK